MLFDQKCCLTKSSEAPVGQKNKLLIPPIWECCGHTRDSFFTHGQIKNPAFFLEIAVKTHSPFGPYFEDHFAFVPLALKKGWIFF